MDRKRYPKKGLAFLVCLVVLIGLSQAGSAAVATPDTTRQLRLDSSFGKFPLYFIENQGQADPRVGYYVQGRETSVYFTSEGLTFALDVSASTGEKTGIESVSFPAGVQGSGKVESRALQRYVMKLDFMGADRAVRPEGGDLKPAVISYFKGTRDQWQTGLGTYGSVVYRELWPGIDLIYTGTVNQLKYSFLVKPGADPDRIRLAYRGVSSLSVTDSGQLEIKTPFKTFQDDAPVAYQDLNGGQVEVSAAYMMEAKTIDGASVYGFSVGDYDRSRILVLDPAFFVYCGYIGGSGEDRGTSIAVDSEGNAYVTGQTNSTEASFPVTVGPDLTFNGGYDDAFVAKINASGTALVYCGYIDGSVVNDIAVDSEGNAYVTGDAGGAGFPVTVGPDLTFNGYGDAFVAKVNASGTALVYCGYIGGSGLDEGTSIAVDSEGNAYVTGRTRSTEASFPVTVGPDLTFNGGYDDAFVAKINASGTALVYCGYIGGSSYDIGYGIAVDSEGNAYVTGSTWSTEVTFPVTAGPDLTLNGGHYDAFVAKVNASGTALVYCGYIGGSSSEIGHGIAVDSEGNAYVTGQTSSTEASFPVTVGPDLTYNGGGDAFVAKVNAPGTALVYCGYIGGSSVDVSYGIAVDVGGNAYITGYTLSTEATFPVTEGPDLTYNGGHAHPRVEPCMPGMDCPDYWYLGDAFVAKVRASGTSLAYCGYIGGSGDDSGLGIAVDASGNAYVIGSTDSTEASFPLTVGPDLTYNGGNNLNAMQSIDPVVGDVFVAKIYGYLPFFTITASAGQNGSISPSGSISLEKGSNQVFTMTPASNYYVSDVIVDGRSVGAVTAYTFTNVTTNHTISVVFGISIESFETGDLSRYPWQVSGSESWTVQGITAYQGTHAAQAPISLEGNASSMLSVTLCVEVSMKISFWLKVSSEPNYDCLIFKIDAIEKGRWSGEVNWTQVSYPVSVGEHTFTWAYWKNAEISEGSDTAWIDYIIFPKGYRCPSFYVLPNKKGGAAVIYLED